MFYKLRIATIIFHFHSSNFLKLDVYYAALKSTTVRQEPAYGIMDFLGNITDTLIRYQLKYQ